MPKTNPKIPQNMQHNSPSRVTFSSYYLLNPAFDITIALRLLGDKINNKTIIKGKPEDFASAPHEVFRLIEGPVSIDFRQRINKPNKEKSDA